MSTLDPYVKELKDWKKIVQDHWLLFDTDAVISILKYNAKSVFHELKKCDTNNCYIYPAYVELMGTNNYKERIERQEIIDQNSFTRISTSEKTTAQDITKIQNYLFTLQIFPSVTDLYLAATLCHFKHSKIYLLASNLKDFPYPLFKRESGIILQNKTHAKVISILSYNHELLI